jgi:hypothetical protein
MSLFSSLYRGLVWFYPPAHRQRFGRLQQEHAEELVAERRQTGDNILVFEQQLLLLLEVVPSIFHEWWAVLRGREPYEDLASYKAQLVSGYLRPNYPLIFLVGLLSESLWSAGYFDLWLPLILTMVGVTLRMSSASLRTSGRFYAFFTTLSAGLIVYVSLITLISSLNSLLGGNNVIPFTGGFFVMIMMNRYWRDPKRSTREIGKTELTRRFVTHQQRRRFVLRGCLWFVGIVTSLHMYALVINGLADIPEEFIGVTTGKKTPATVWERISDEQHREHRNGSSLSVDDYTLPENAEKLAKAYRVERPYLDFVARVPAEEWDEADISVLNNEEISQFIFRSIPPSGFNLRSALAVVLAHAQVVEDATNALDDLTVTYGILEKQLTARNTNEFTQYTARESLGEWYKAANTVAPRLSDQQKTQLLARLQLDHRTIAIDSRRDIARTTVLLISRHNMSPLAGGYPTSYFYQPRVHASFVAERFSNDLQLLAGSCDAVAEEPKAAEGVELAMKWYDILLPNSTGRWLESYQPEPQGLHLLYESCELDTAQELLRQKLAV